MIEVYKDFTIASKFLENAGEVSLKLTVDQNAAKLILLGAASEFEVALCDVVRRFVRSAANESDQILSLVEKKAISRQYHTWFDWKAPTANPFYSLFGDNFLNSMKDITKNDDQFANSVKNFLEIGQLRNSLVHNNFSTFYMEKTSDEIFESYNLAQFFVERINAELEGFLKK